MPIKSVILDVSNTLVRGGQPVANIPEMVADLKGLGVQIFVASNDPVSPATMQLLGLSVSNLLVPGVVGGYKGSKRFVEYVCAALDIAQNEIVYLGDNQTDMTEAVNSNVAFFLAAWANANYPYGHKVASPMKFVDIVKYCFLKEALWYYRVDGCDHLGRAVTVRALLNPDEAINTGIRTLLKDKTGGSTPIGRFTLSEYLSLHLLASLYLEGFHLPYAGQKPLWSIYPAHAGKQSGVLHDLAAFGARLFREQYAPGLIHRHTPARKRSTLRRQHIPVVIGEQTRTIHLTYPPEISGRRILVFDDFTTDAHSFETSRNFLLNADAADVIGIAVGKYGYGYNVYSPSPGVAWDSYQSASIDETSFRSRLIKAEINPAALAYFRNLPS